MFSKNLTLWQWAERYLEARYPNEAIQELQKSGMPAEGQADYCATYAKALNVLGRYDEAEAMARQGLTFDSAHKRCRIQLADALHLKGETEAGHQLYNEILYQHISQPSLGQDNTFSFEQRVGFDGNILHSPVYAINLLEHSPDATEATWQWAEDEFYWSPYFRCHHAYHLIDQGEGLRAFAKLLALIKEMPWVKEAALNTMAILEQLDPGGRQSLAADDRSWLANLIATNGWSTDGMNNLGSKPFRLKNSVGD
ncbi:tetratricopeptide repeat protein [Leptolyngbya sp. AN02str]|uniref:tetratricopeptide repeat protein n=1 Tax=Leptolyngbya sp. AN02str TaxID=3423363 RepID=UPI003D31CC13